MLYRWGTLGKMQLMLRKAAKALYANDKFTEAEMHNYRMAVTEREVSDSNSPVQWILPGEKWLYLDA